MKFNTSPSLLPSHTYFIGILHVFRILDTALNTTQGLKLHLNRALVEFHAMGFHKKHIYINKQKLRHYTK